MCLCVCVCVHQGFLTGIAWARCVYIDMCLYICVCVCVCTPMLSD